MLYRSLDPELKKQLETFLFDNKPVPNLKLSSKEKKVAEQEFDKQYYKESDGKEKEIEILNALKTKENIEKSDNLKFFDKKLIDSIDLYNLSPYKVKNG